MIDERPATEADCFHTECQSERNDYISVTSEFVQASVRSQIALYGRIDSCHLIKPYNLHVYLASQYTPPGPRESLISIQSAFASRSISAVAADCRSARSGVRRNIIGTRRAQGQGWEGIPAGFSKPGFTGSTGPSRRWRGSVLKSWN